MISRLILTRLKSFIDKKLYFVVYKRSTVEVSYNPNVKEINLVCMNCDRVTYKEISIPYKNLWQLNSIIKEAQVTPSQFLIRKYN